VSDPAHSKELAPLFKAAIETPELTVFTLDLTGQVGRNAKDLIPLLKSLTTNPEARVREAANAAMKRVDK
jgi:hypothetical protein